jgi:hypothetical protein
MSVHPSIRLCVFPSVRCKLGSVWAYKEKSSIVVPRADSSVSTARPSMLSIYGVSQGFNHHSFFINFSFPWDRDEAQCLGGRHALLLDLMLYKHMIVGPSKVVWIHTAFEPTIHHLPPRSTFSIPWFRLRDCSRILTLEQVASPQ